MGPDGHSYERAAIEEALRIKPESPMTRQHMTFSQLSRNFALKGLIERYLAGGSSSSSSSSSTSTPQRPSEAILPSHPQPFSLEASVISLDYNLSASAAGQESRLLSLSLTPSPSTSSSRPLGTVVIAMLDVSGSMNEAANMKDDVKAVGDDGGLEFSRLDLVKHSMKTVIKMLHQATPSSSSSSVSDNYLIVIKFSNKASVVLPATMMNASGVERANAAISQLEPGWWMGTEYIRIKI